MEILLDESCGIPLLQTDLKDSYGIFLGEIED